MNTVLVGFTWNYPAAAPHHRPHAFCGLPRKYGAPAVSLACARIRTVEVYYRGADFLISAGGRFDDGKGFVAD